MTNIHANILDNAICDGKCAPDECVCGDAHYRHALTNLLLVRKDRDTLRTELEQANLEIAALTENADHHLALGLQAANEKVKVLREGLDKIIAVPSGRGKPSIYHGRMYDIARKALEVSDNGND